MRLETLRIENFRSIRDETISFSPYTCLVGQNGAGKSAILASLNILFRNTEGAGVPTSTLSEEDFYQRKTSEPITVVATFSDLSEQAVADFAPYLKNGLLTIKARAIWSESTRRAEVKQLGSILEWPALAPWFDANRSGAKVKDLREVYASIRRKVTELPEATTKATMERALQNYQGAHPDQATQGEKEDQFYGWTNGENRLRKYVEWVFIPAVKDASTEQMEGKTTALGELLQRSIRQKVDFEQPLAALRIEASQKYEQIIDRKQADLQSLSAALERRLQQWSHEDARLTVRWNHDPARSVVVTPPLGKVAVGEGGFIGEVSRLGHGLQRSFLVAVLQELTEGSSSSVPRLILGFEEPELYQHPPQAKYLAALLEKLTKGDSQVIVTTHSPYFVGAHTLGSIRLVRRNDAKQHTEVTGVDPARLTQRLAAALGEEPKKTSALMASLESILQPSQNELFFCGCPILVEGLEDVAYLATYLELTGRWESVRANGGHFVIAAGKANLSRPLAIALELRMPAYVVLDADSDKDGPNERDQNERDNRCVLNLLQCGDVDPFPNKVVIRKRVTMWPENIGASVRDDFGILAWDTAQTSARDKYGLYGIKSKNSVLVVATLEELWAKGQRSQILESVTASIVEYATERRTSRSSSKVD